MLRRAIFLDRDGTLTVEGKSLPGSERLSLLPGAATSVCHINRAGWQTVLLTNQPAVAAGRFDEDTLADLHERLRADLVERGGRLDGIYHCPHDPSAPLEGYRKECGCRLPGIGMFERARDEMGIDLTASFFVSASAQRLPAAGMASILLRGSQGPRPSDRHPALETGTLERAVDWALGVRC